MQPTVLEAGHDCSKGAVFLHKVFIVDLLGAGYSSRGWSSIVNKTKNVIEWVWVQAGPRGEARGALGMNLAFQLQGLNLTATETLSLSQGLFVGIHFTPLASSFLYPQTADLSFSKGEWQIQSRHQGIPGFSQTSLAKAWTFGKLSDMIYVCQREGVEDRGQIKARSQRYRIKPATAL